MAFASAVRALARAAVASLTGAVLAAALPAIAHASAQPAAVQVASVEGITEYRLANGLRVLLFPDDSQPTITVNITYLVGSRHEGYGETGMAHLLEHLLFKGTPTNSDIHAQFNRRGARWNGTTSFDRTNYFETFPASPENLEWAIRLEADRMINSFIAEKDLASEMTVVRNEYERGENDPRRVLYKRLRSVAFDWHNYQNSPIGNRSDIENVAIENLRAFYRRYYQPDNAVLLIAGRFDPDTALRLVVDAFGKIPKPARKLPALWTVEPVQDGERVFTVRRAGNIQILVLGYKIPGVRHTDADALACLGDILDHAPNGRLYRQLVETGLAVSVSARTDHTLDPGLMTIDVAVKEGEPLDEVERRLIEAVESVHLTPPTDEELQRVRALRQRAFHETMSSPRSLALALSEAIAAGDWRLWFHTHARQQAVTAADIVRVARTYLRRDNRTVGRFVPTSEPQRAPMPATPSVAEALKDFKPTQMFGAGEAFDPAPENIEARTRRFTLANGMKVALLPKRTRGRTVHLALRAHYGDARSRFGKSTLEAVAGSMLTRGTTRYTRAQLADEFNRLMISGDIGFGSARLQTTGPNLIETLELLAHVLRAPAFPEAELDQLRKQWIARLESESSDPAAVSNEAIGKHFNAYERGDPRYYRSRAEIIEDLRGVTVERLREMHRDFMGFSNAELAIVGDFDERAVRAALQRLFGDWKSRLPYARIENPYRAVAPARRMLAVPDKASAVFRAQLMIDMREDDPDFPALYLANHMFGGAGLNARIGKRIRDREGLSYGVYTSLDVSNVDRRGIFSVTATAAPENIARLEAIFREELETARRDGFTAAELAAAKSGLLAARRQWRTQDGYVARYWLERLYLNQNFLEAARMDAKLQAATLEEVNAAFRKHIDPARLAVVKAGDFGEIPEDSARPAGPDSLATPGG